MDHDPREASLAEARRPRSGSSCHRPQAAGVPQGRSVDRHWRGDFGRQVRTARYASEACGALSLRVVVAGPSRLGRQLLAENLRAEGIDVVADVAGPEELIGACPEGAVDAAVLELVGEDASYEQAITSLLEMGTRSVVAARSVSQSRLTAALLAGASGFVFFDRCSPAELADTVRTATRGGAALHPLVAEAVLAQLRQLHSGPAERGDPAPSLTARERDVLVQMVEGGTMKDIAVRLDIAVKTVESHQRQVFAKLKVRNRAQAVAVAHSRGLVDETGDPGERPGSSIRSG